MKKLVLIAALVGLTSSAFAQSVVFANTASAAFKLTTNNAAGTASGFMSGANGYRIGLYAQEGLNHPESSLVLVGLATNAAPAALAGNFNGGNPFFLPSPYAAGDSITFQIRAWAFSGGLSYEEAFANGAAAGRSALGFTSLGGGTVFPGVLFGTAAGQVGSFTIAPVPEPSSIAIGLLGLGAIALFRRRK